MSITPYEIAQRFVGTEELPGHNMNQPMIMAWLTLDQAWPTDDEVPWCAGFIGWCHWLADKERTRSLRARSWLTIGIHMALEGAQPGDVAIMNRAGAPHDPTLIDAPGHVGFYVGHDDTFVHILGGNQSNQVKVSPYNKMDLLGIRRIL